MQKNAHTTVKRAMRISVGNRGTALIEFAIVLPVLLLIIFGMIELGVAFYNKAMITNASREGARYGVVRCYCDPSRSTNGNDWAPDTGITTRVLNYCGDYLITFDDEITGDVATTITRDITCDPNDPNDPCTLTVQVDYQYGFLLLPSFIADLTGGITLTGVTTMRLE